jgi:hypothetical protein
VYLLIDRVCENPRASRAVALDAVGWQRIPNPASRVRDAAVEISLISLTVAGPTIAVVRSILTGEEPLAVMDRNKAAVAIPSAAGLTGLLVYRSNMTKFMRTNRKALKHAAKGQAKYAAFLDPQLTVMELRANAAEYGGYSARMVNNIADTFSKPIQVVVAGLQSIDAPTSHGFPIELSETQWSRLVPLLHANGGGEQHGIGAQQDLVQRVYGPYNASAVDRIVARLGCETEQAVAALAACDVDDGGGQDFDLNEERLDILGSTIQEQAFWDVRM